MVIVSFISQAMCVCVCIYMQSYISISYSLSLKYIFTDFYQFKKSTYSFFVIFGSDRHDMTRQAALGKCTSVLILTSVIGKSSQGNISGAV